MLEALALDRFRRDHWTRKPFFGEVSKLDYDRLHDELAGFDVEELILRQGGLASVWFEDRLGHAQAVDLAPRDALKFYRGGFTVFLPDAATPTIRGWQTALGAALGRAPGSFLCSMFASHRGNVTGCHFDHIENFTIQLRGTKRWRYAPNPQVPLPMVNFSGRTTRPYQEEMWLYATQPLPEQVPVPAQQIDVAPGTLLYLPRGMWHEVEATEDSLSLLIGFGSCTWIDVVVPAIRTLLMRRAHWRETAALVRDAASPDAEQTLRGLLNELAGLLQGIDPADLLPRPGNAAPSPALPARFRKNQLSTLGCYPVADDPRSIDLVATVHQGELSSAREVRAPAAWRAALQEAIRPDRFAIDELAKLDVAPADRTEIVKLMLALDLVRGDAEAQP